MIDESRHRRRGTVADEFRIEHDPVFRCWRVAAPDWAVWLTVGRYRYRSLVRAVRFARACRAGRMKWLVASDKQDLAADRIDAPVLNLCQCDVARVVLAGATGLYDRYEDADDATWAAMRADPTGLALFYLLPVKRVACSARVHSAAHRRAARR
jgi:hypothetical protein